MAWFKKNFWAGPLACGLLAVLFRIPFVFRYDLNFNTEDGVCYLMAKRILKGEFPVYFWDQQYAGTTPQFVTAFFFWIFGPSIELSCFVSILAYGAAVFVSVIYIRRYIGFGQAIAAGVTGAIGVPYVLHYCAEPAGGLYCFEMLMTAAFLAVAAWVGVKGWSPWRAAAVGLLTGHCWYYNKQCLICVATIGFVFMVLPQGRARLKEFFKFSYLAIFIATFLAGYSPELYYRLTHEPPKDAPSFGFASLTEMQRTLYWFVRVLPAYYNGDPLGRLPENVHYQRYNPAVDSLPQGWADYLGIAIAWIVFVLIARRAWLSWKSRNLAVLLLAAQPLINAGLVIVSKAAVGEYYGPKRYLFCSSLVLVLWVGIEAWEAWRKNWKPLAVFLALMVPVSVYHHYQLLQWPDELADYRKVVQQLKENDLHYGITWYTYAFSMASLSDEQSIFACMDYNDHKIYSSEVAKHDRLVLVHPGGMPNVPPVVQIFGRPFHLEGEPHRVGELGWTVYKVAAQP